MILSPDGQSRFPLSFDKVCYQTADGKKLLKDLCFRLEERQHTLLLGANGAGKSLTLRLAHGLIQATSGQVKWRQAPQKGFALHAMVFQRPVLFRRTAYANLDYALKRARLSKNDRKTRIEEALLATGLWHLKDRQARVLSGGEQQRLAIARAMSLQPEVLFMDEPTASLDPRASESILRLIDEIKAAGTTVVLSIHNLHQARDFGGRALFLHEGELVEDATTEGFFANPQSQLSENFIFAQSIRDR